MPPSGEQKAKGLMATRDEVEAEIRGHLAAHGVCDAEIRVQQGPFGDWIVAVIAAAFEGRAPAERRRLALGDPPTRPTAWCDVLTPDEAKVAGALPADIESDDLPLWPDRLDRDPGDRGPVVFASDFDDDIKAPVLATFYSLRGGVGRTTALVMTARTLAARGRRVVAVDMDLEAPGLATLFGIKEEEIRADQGVTALLAALDSGGDDLDVTAHLIRVSEADDLYCLPAGRASARYAQRLALLDPASWYREDRNPLRRLLDLLKTGLPFAPDAILLDARTGLSGLSGPLLFDVPDIAIVVFFPHPQALHGTKALVQALGSARTTRPMAGQALAPEPRFIASPLPSGHSFEAYARRALEWVADWIEPINARRGPHPRLAETEITHLIEYGEVLAASDRPDADGKSALAYEPIADWIARVLPTEAEAAGPPTLADRKAEILAELSFPTGSAEQQDDLRTTFLETQSVRRALDPRVTLVRGRKGTGKTALFRRLADHSTARPIVVTAPQTLQSDWPWTWGRSEFEAVDRRLAATGASWETFWLFFILKRIEAALGHPPPAPERSSLPTIRALDDALKETDLDLHLQAELRAHDAALPPDTLLLFDGLDTGFGSAPNERRRRRDATQGLFGLAIDQAGGFKNLRFKIMLRDDIWRALNFDNKSHLYGREVSLVWRHRIDFLKLVLSHAMRAPSFVAVLSGEPSLDASGGISLDRWSEEQVRRAWSLLIGDRMKGSGTAFTANWVWNRLRDGNDDRNPRYLLMLFREVTKWEIQERQKTPYERSVLRPRSLERCLPQVSEAAFGALREEFSELDPVFDALNGQRTPLPAEQLKQANIQAELIELAREVGLISVYEGTDTEPVRYAVPEIYRLALNMRRKGQA